MHELIFWGSLVKSSLVKSVIFGVCGMNTRG